jgi:hypothetical protein
MEQGSQYFESPLSASAVLSFTHANPENEAVVNVSEGEERVQLSVLQSTPGIPRALCDVLSK